MRTCKALALAGVLLTMACSSGKEYEQALGVVVDVSGTYVDQVGEVCKVIRTGVLPQALPGDSLVVIRIDSQSYEKANVVAKVMLDHRPSRANAQKLAFAAALDDFAAHAEYSEYTDIPGALMLCADHLKETEAGSKAILIFSDLKEDLPQGTIRQLDTDEFAGIHVAAVNVKRLQGDNVNPEVYRRRLLDWERKVTASSAAQWKVIVDPAKLPSFLESIR
jgi:hypothetical protein